MKNKKNDSRERSFFVNLSYVFINYSCKSREYKSSRQVTPSLE